MDINKPHKRLEAWRQSFDLVLELYRATQVFPADERFGLVSQIRRASVSIPVNIAEGAARKSKKEFINFLSISSGSLSELDTLLLLSRELNFISSSETDRLLQKMDIIGKLIFGLMKKLRQSE